MATWRKEKGRWGRSFRRRPCFWWSHDTHLTSQPEETRGPEADPLTDISIDVITETFTTVDMPVASKRASLWCKVDTDPGGNVMPLQAFAKLFPNQLTKMGMPTGLQKCNTKLRAYNGTNIPQLSALNKSTHHLEGWGNKGNKQDGYYFLCSWYTRTSNLRITFL